MGANSEKIKERANSEKIKERKAKAKGRKARARAKARTRARSRLTGFRFWASRRSRTDLRVAVFVALLFLNARVKLKRRADWRFAQIDKCLVPAMFFPVFDDFYQ